LSDEIRIRKLKPNLTLRSTRAFQTVVMPLRAPKNRPAVILGAVALVVGGLAGGFWLGRLGPHRLLVASVPPGARILRGGQEAGLTPQPLALQSGEVLQLEKVGFHPTVVRYQAGDPPPVVTLEPILTDEVIRTSPNRAVVIMDSVRLGGLTPIVVKGWDQSRKHDLICIVGEWVMSSTFNPGEAPGGKVLSLGATAPAWKATGPRPAPPRISATGTVALARVLDRERENEAIRSLLLSPAPRSAIYAGKLIATSLLMIAVEILLTILVGVLFSTGVFTHLGWLALVLVLGTLGFSATGVVFSAALLRSRSREALLGALLFPIVIPVLLAASRATACLFDPLSPDLEPVSFWTRFLFATDVIYILLGLWVFEPVVIGE